MDVTFNMFMKANLSCDVFGIKLIHCWVKGTPPRESFTVHVVLNEYRRAEII
jgi:hypothetical protein